jgi:hypothetical protein
MPRNFCKCDFELPTTRAKWLIFQGNTAMLSKIALTTAIVLGTASGVVAATKHHGPAVHAQMSASALNANAKATSDWTDDPPGSAFQNAGYRSALGYPPR